MRIIRMWMYLALAASLTLLFTVPLWGVVYGVIFLIWTAWTFAYMRRLTAGE